MDGCAQRFEFDEVFGNEATQAQIFEVRVIADLFAH